MQSNMEEKNMDIREAKKVKQLVTEYENMSREYNKASVCLKNIPANGGRVIIEPNIGEFVFNQDEIIGLLNYIKNGRDFRMKLIEDELSEYRKCENVPLNYEDDLK